MKTNILSINSFIGILSSSILFFLSIASISNVHAATYDFNFAAVGDWGCGDVIQIPMQLLKE